MDSDFQTQVLYPGVGGVDLKRTPENVQLLKLCRMTNLRRSQEGAVEPRPGLVRLLTSGQAAAVHSIIRLNDPIAGGYTRLFGIGTELWAGRDDTHPVIKIDEGYSGDPLSFVAYRPPLSNQSWVYIGDRLRMRKVRPDRLDLPVGLAPPELPPTTTLITEEKVVVEVFDAALWTNNAGSGGAPSHTLQVDGPEGLYIKFTSAVGSASAGYYNYWARPLVPAVNMNRLGASGREASDSDFIQFWIRMDRPDRISEVKLYFILSDDYSGTVVPGTSGSANTNAYVKSFRPTDFTNSIEQVQSAIDATAFAKERRDLTDSLTPTTETRGGEVLERVATLDQSRFASRQATFGRDQWIQLAAVGFPLRRGEFLRIGNDASLSWDTVRGLVISVLTNTNQVVNVSFDDLVLTGGHGPDSAEPGSQQYEYIYRNTDLRTGARSNFSRLQNADFHLDSLRRGIRVQPTAYTADDADGIRQEFFRRGGTLVQGFYFVGVNASNGASFTDSVPDATALQSGQAEFNNYQPVETAAADGTQIHAQPLRSIWGPVGDVLMGCGDPYRPGSAYWCKRGEADHWPTANRAEVCAPSEELLVGHEFLGQSFVFSRARLYNLVPAISPTGGVNFIPQSTSCDKGPLSPWATCVTPYGIAFVTPDGVHLTSGGPPTPLSDDDIWPLFHNEPNKPVNGYYPVDFSQVEAIRLAYHDNELWLLFQDTAGNRAAWVFYFAFKFWRPYFFARPTAVAYSEEKSGGWHPPVITSSLEESEFMGFYTILPLVPAIVTSTVLFPEPPKPQLLLGDTLGKAYYHDGFSDDGEEIDWDLDTPALNQGMVRETKQYADVILDLDRQGEAIEVSAIVDEVTVGLTPKVIEDETYADPTQDGA